MKKINRHSAIGIGLIFLFSLNVSCLLAGFITNNVWYIIAAIMLSVAQFVLHDLFRRKHSILQHYPFKARLKHALKKVNPFFSKLFFKDDILKTSVSFEQYQLIVKRANNIQTEIVSRVLSPSDVQVFECLKYMYWNVSTDLTETDLRVEIGTAQCAQPYTSSILNIGSLNHDILSNARILALSEGANIQGCAVNTGEKGVSPYLIRGGSDLIWQIAHEDRLFRNPDSTFNESVFKVTASRPYIKMIEIVLPRNEQSIIRRLARDRMIIFLKQLRDLSGGKPVGIRLFNPSQEVINCICKSMNATQIFIDFITIDSTVSGNGFDPISIGSATKAGYFESLTCTKSAIDKYELPTKIIASEGIVSEYDILRSIALGASVCYCTAPMILALNTGMGFKFLDKMNQRVRVANFHRNTINATVKLMELCGYHSLEDVKPNDFYRKMNFFEMKSLKEIYFDGQLVKAPHLFSGLS